MILCCGCTINELAQARILSSSPAARTIALYTATIQAHWQLKLTFRLSEDL